MIKGQMFLLKFLDRRLGGPDEICIKNPRLLYGPQKIFSNMLQYTFGDS